MLYAAERYERYGMDEQRFADVMREERERLHREREEIFNQQQELENKLAAINREMAAVDAYESTKTGRGPGPRGGTSRGRARRGSRREALLQLIRDSGGLSRGEILERMGLKGDRSGEMSVSNALTALTKSSQVERREKKYYAA
jgi:hypothetical protein